MSEITFNKGDNGGVIAVPINKAGEHDCDHGYFDSENIRDFDITSDELRYMFDKGLIDKMNIEYDLLIDIYETETVSTDKLKGCLKIIKKSGGPYRNGCFAQAFEAAIRYDTYAQLDF